MEQVCLSTTKLHCRKAIHLGTNATVIQAEVSAVGRAASHLKFAETKNKNDVIKYKLRTPD